MSFNKSNIETKKVNDQNKPEQRQETSSLIKKQNGDHSQIPVELQFNQSSSIQEAEQDLMSRFVATKHPDTKFIIASILTDLYEDKRINKGKKVRTTRWTIRKQKYSEKVEKYCQNWEKKACGLNETGRDLIKIYITYLEKRKDKSSDTILAHSYNNLINLFKQKIKKIDEKITTSSVQKKMKRKKIKKIILDANNPEKAVLLFEKEIKENPPSTVEENECWSKHAEKIADLFYTKKQYNEETLKWLRRAIFLMPYPHNKNKITFLREKYEEHIKKIVSIWYDQKEYNKVIHTLWPLSQKKLENLGLLKPYMKSLQILCDEKMQELRKEFLKNGSPSTEIFSVAYYLSELKNIADAMSLDSLEKSKLNNYIKEKNILLSDIFKEPKESRSTSHFFKYFRKRKSTSIDKLTELWKTESDKTYPQRNNLDTFSKKFERYEKTANEIKSAKEANKYFTLKDYICEIDQMELHGKIKNVKKLSPLEEDILENLEHYSPEAMEILIDYLNQTYSGKYWSETSKQILEKLGEEKNKICPVYQEMLEHMCNATKCPYYFIRIPNPKHPNQFDACKLLENPQFYKEEVAIHYLSQILPTIEKEISKLRISKYQATQALKRDNKKYLSEYEIEFQKAVTRYLTKKYILMLFGSLPEKYLPESWPFKELELPGQLAMHNYGFWWPPNPYFIFQILEALMNINALTNPQDQTIQTLLNEFNLWVERERGSPGLNPKPPIEYYKNAIDKFFDLLKQIANLSKENESRALILFAIKFVFTKDLMTNKVPIDSITINVKKFYNAAINYMGKREFALLKACIEDSDYLLHLARNIYTNKQTGKTELKELMSNIQNAANRHNLPKGCKQRLNIIISKMDEIAKNINKPHDYEEVSEPPPPERISGNNFKPTAPGFE